MREQVCIYMCPWPRIQSAMMDEKSLARHLQGLARRTARQRQEGGKRARACSATASIACNASTVCPTGIDIREGPQIGCITCALCIDACDKVMDEVGRPRGLIDYATLEDASGKQQGRRPARRGNVLRPRTLVYFAGWGGDRRRLLFALGTRTHLDIASRRIATLPFLLMGRFRAQRLHAQAPQHGDPARRLEVTLSGIDNAVIWSETAAANRRRSG